MKQTFLISLLLLVIRNCSSEKITLRIDLNEPIAVTDPKFLSLTIDPVTLLAGNAVRYVQRVFIITSSHLSFCPSIIDNRNDRNLKVHNLSKYTNFSPLDISRAVERKNRWKEGRRKEREAIRDRFKSDEQNAEKTLRTIPRITFENKIQSTLRRNKTCTCFNLNFDPSSTPPTYVLSIFAERNL